MNGQSVILVPVVIDNTAGTESLNMRQGGFSREDPVDKPGKRDHDAIRRRSQS